MSRFPLSLDARRALRPACSKEGLASAEWHALERRAAPLMSALRRERAAGRLAFAALPHDRAAWREISREAARLKNVRHVLTLGIGGSALGLKAIEGVAGGSAKLRVLDNVDPDTARAALAGLDWRKTLVNVVSKSGTTAETLALLLRVLAVAGRKLPADNIVTITDSENSDLALLAREKGWRRLGMPREVGGRFSVLTSAALFPALASSLPAGDVLAGAREAERALWSMPPTKNPALLLALLLHAFAARKEKKILVVMPYADRLLPLAHWFAQLWGESLGKQTTSPDGTEIRAGSTPVVARGASDQHSQLQLYVEGPRDKAVLFLRAGAFSGEGKLSHEGKHLPAFSFLSGRSLRELFRAEAEATAASLARAGCPNLSLTAPRADARALGAFFYLFETATVAAARLWRVNAFDQPGVESGKRAARAMMTRGGKTDRRRPLP